MVEDTRLKEISLKLFCLGSYTMAIRLFRPELRSELYRNPFANEEEVYNYLINHIDEKDARIAVYNV